MFFKLKIFYFQILLDTAVVMMQQYSSLAAVSQQIPTTSSASSGVQSNLSSGQNVWSNPVPTESPKIAKVAPTTSSQVNSTTDNVDVSNVDKPSTSKTEVQEETTMPLTPEEEIRRRRLQKFQQNTTDQVQN